MTKRIAIFSLTSFLVMASLFTAIINTFAATRIQVVPSITIQHQYDDNIYLNESEREKSDHITTITPSIAYNAESKVGNFSLRYAPTFAKYYDYDENDTIRHSAGLTAGYYFNRNVSFDFSDSFLRSEDVVEETIDGGTTKQRFRENRQTYYRNNADVSFNFLYSRNNSLSVGFFHQLLENNDETVDDGVIYGPSVTITHWFTVKTGTELSYQYERGEFTSDDGSVPENDYDGHDANIRLLYKFTPHTTGWIGYGYTVRSFDGHTPASTDEDYSIHSASIGFNHTFSRYYTISLSAGAYRQLYDGTSDNLSGLTYGLSLTRQWQRASFTIAGSGGWDEDFLAGNQDRADFSEYVSGSASFDYRLSKNIGTYANISYRRDDYQTNIDENTVVGNIGASYAMFNWLSLSLDYYHITRSSDDPDDEFNDNRVSLSLTASKPIDIQ